MFSRVILLSIVLFASVGLFGQVYQHDFGTTTISAHPYSVVPSTLDANLSNSSWSNSTSSWTSFAGSSGQAISLNNSSGTPTITLTFDIGIGCTLDITAFDFWRRRSTSGAQNWSMTINGTNVGSGTVPTTGANIGNTTVSGMTGLTGTVTIVISLSGASGTGTFRLDDFTLFGSTSCGGSSHTVIFNGNGSDGGSMSNQTASSSTALTSNSYTQTGCTFTEWNTAADGSGTSYADGATYNFSADITLYAQWNCPTNCTSIFSDNFGGTLSQWSNTGDWTISGGELNHNLSGVAGTSYIYSNIGNQDLTSSDYEWSFCMRNGAWDPSSSNYFGYYLIANATNLLGTPDGYAVGVNLTGTSDLLTLYRVDGGVYTAIVTSAFDWNSGNDVCIRIVRASSGLWELFYDSGSGESSAGTSTDNTYTSGQYTGALFEFSSTRAGELWIDDVNICGSTPAPNTITTGTISGGPFSVQCDTNDTGSITFTSTDSFGVGNIYTAQLSDASGNFGAAINIGTLSSTANSGTINITIPAGTISGSGYKIRVVSSNPYIIGTESANFTITLTDGSCSPPHITSVMFNGCDPAGCGGEGRSEIVFVNTGANSVIVNSANLDLIYPGAPPYDLLGTIVSNSATITTMNDSAACGTLFFDANGQTVPQNSILLLVSDAVCAEVNFDWSGLCGQGPIYVVFGQSGTAGDTWHDSGNFGNSSGTKTFDLDITATDGITYGYSYTYVSGNQGDGEYAAFSSTSPGGNAINTGVLANCNITPAVLPIELLSFTGKTIGSFNLLEWETTTEINNDYFTLERSSNATLFSELGTIQGAGNSNTLLHYQFTDNAPLEGVNYYRLKQTDFDGTYSYSNIIALSNNATNFTIWNSSNTLFVKSDKENLSSSLKIYNLLGELVFEKVFEENTSVETSTFSSGIYLVKVQTAKAAFTQKVKF